jgi:hypothetical protein
MFVTHPSFRLPVQFGGPEVNWRSVELAIRASMFLVTTRDPREETARDFFLGSEGDLTQFIEDKPAGEPVGLALMLCPGFSTTGTWQIVPIRRVDRVKQETGRRAGLVFTAEDGRRYAGFPAEPVTEFDGPLVPLAAFA